ncbi:hypothetical protein [Streptomyces sp. NPDC054975]
MSLFTKRYAVEDGADSKRSRTCVVPLRSSAARADADRSVEAAEPAENAAIAAPPATVAAADQSEGSTAHPPKQPLVTSTSSRLPAGDAHGSPEPLLRATVRYARVISLPAGILDVSKESSVRFTLPSVPRPSARPYVSSSGPTVAPVPSAAAFT